MKSIVNRRTYDTDSSELLAEVKKSFGVYGQDPDNDWTESLYKKRFNGEYFVLGVGGKNTPFSEYANGKKEAGSRVIAWRTQNLDNAKLWVHDNCPDKFQELFENRGDDELVVTTIMLSKRAKKKLKRYSEEQGITISEILRRYAETLYIDD